MDIVLMVGLALLLSFAAGLYAADLWRLIGRKPVRQDSSAAATLAVRDQAWAAAQGYRADFRRIYLSGSRDDEHDSIVLRIAISLAAMETSWRAALRCRMEQGEVVEDEAL
jgi:hypothetical protein